MSLSPGLPSVVRVDLILAVIVWLCLAAFVGDHAGRLGRRPLRWFVAALLLSPLIAFLFLLAAGRSYRSHCPHCGEPLEPDTIRCPRCLADLANEADDELIPDRRRYAYNPRPAGSSRVRRRRR